MNSIKLFCRNRISKKCRRFMCRRRRRYKRRRGFGIINKIFNKKCVRCRWRGRKRINKFVMMGRVWKKVNKLMERYLLVFSKVNVSMFCISIRNIKIRND